MDDVPIWFSGSKEFHVLVELAHTPPPAAGFHRVARTLAEALAARAGVKIDPSIYDMAHIIRLPNTKHPKTGLFKRRIESDALFRLDVSGIREIARHPAGDGIPAVQTVSEQLVIDWREAEATTARTTEARVVTRRDYGNTDARAPRYFLELVRFGVAESERHTTLLRCAAWLAEQGAPPSLVATLLTEPGRDIGLTPKDVDRQIACGIEHARRQPCVTVDPNAFERWAIEHEADPIPAGALDFPFGANAPQRRCRMMPTFTTSADLFGTWFAEVERGEPPVRFRVPSQFDTLDIRPGRLILFGGAPDGGMTAAPLQMGIDPLRKNESVRMLMANVEMVPALLVERIASRVATVPLTAIADCTMTADQLSRVPAAVESLASIVGRLAFLSAPFTLEHVAAAGTAFKANVLVLDYIQRFTVGDGKGDKREQLETAATVLRRFCDAAAAVLVASAGSIPNARYARESARQAAANPSHSSATPSAASVNVVTSHLTRFKPRSGRW